MRVAASAPRTPAGHVPAEWADQDVGLYLGRCQIDTPPDLVARTWERVLALRPRFDRVVDFGAGDGRFAMGGVYGSYVGYELDGRRMPAGPLPPHARVEHACAFSKEIGKADLCVGNPPFVRNQDLPEGWRAQVADALEARSGIRLSGLANAWQYFFLLSLITTTDDGVCALVIPYEWVSRPSVADLRAHIAAQGWHVDVHRLSDHSFDTVLTTASITIVDKGNRDGVWRFFDTGSDGVARPMPSTSGAHEGHVAYMRRKRVGGGGRAVRGLSPGAQDVFVLTEGERARLGLRPGRDVLRCATSLRHLPSDCSDVEKALFDNAFREAGLRCWLINPGAASELGPLRTYLDSVDPARYATATCMGRETWWDFKMPEVPAALIATCFKGGAPKAVANTARLIAVGGVAGLHGIEPAAAQAFLAHLGALDLRGRIVAHAKQLMKLEIGQLNTLIAEFEASTNRG